MRSDTWTEARACLEINRQLTACEWLVQNRAEMNLYGGQGVAAGRHWLRYHADLDAQRELVAR